MVSAAPKQAKSVKATAKKSSPSSHPPFLEMITEAIVTLKERTGSSQIAIQKFIEERHKQLPSTFRKLLLVQLKRLVAVGKLVKVKNSFKISPTGKPAAAKAVAAKPKAEKSKAAPKTKPASKPKVVSVKSKADAIPTAKRKTAAKPVAKPTKVAKTATKASPSKAAFASKSKKAAVASKPKKMAAVKVAKKPKSVKSPIRKTRK